jgi:hypothetical protein
MVQCTIDGHFVYNHVTAAICERFVGCPPQRFRLPGSPIIDF